VERVDGDGVLGLEEGGVDGLEDEKLPRLDDPLENERLPEENPPERGPANAPNERTAPRIRIKTFFLLNIFTPA
jgi:hypothetical protein